MKQHNFKTLLIVLFLAGLTACSNQKKLETKSTATFLPLKERNKALAEAADWASITKQSHGLVSKYQVRLDGFKVEITFGAIVHARSPHYR
jgi:hypothetical protein